MVDANIEARDILKKFTAEVDANGQYYSYVDETDLNTTDAAAIKTQWFSDMEWIPTGQQS